MDKIKTDLIEKFPAFFRATQANKGYWGEGSFFGGKSRSGRTIPANGDANFKMVWQKLKPLLNDGGDVTIWQFLAVTSIMINETGGSFMPVSELGGLKYMYGTNGGKKKSYNTYAANKTAYSLFNDPVFMEAHKELANYDYVNTKGKKDTKWNLSVYPLTIADSEAGIIAEADFFKFRGRGLLQTTFRENYIPLVKKILLYSGENAGIKKCRDKWKVLSGSDAQKSATVSRNTDWDELFMNTDLEFAAIALKAFFDARAGIIQYNTAADYHLKNKGVGSLYYTGLKVGGTDSYGQLLRARVSQIYSEMKKKSMV